MEHSNDVPTVGSALRRLEENEELDPLAERGRRLTEPLRHGRLRHLLAGEPLGHALHPMLTDLPIGFWTSAGALDLLGGKDRRAAAQTLVGWGVLAVPVAALAGASDWSVTEDPRVRRVGMVHALGNFAAAMAYLRSWRSRRRGRHAAGVMWGLLGAALATVGGHLGGHLTYRLGAGVAPAESDFVEGGDLPEVLDATDAAAARRVVGPATAP